MSRPEVDAEADADADATDAADADATDATASARPGAGPGRRLDLDRLARLEEERDFLLSSLRDLEAEHDAGDLGDDDYEALKGDYTARAAAAIRAIQADEERLVAAAPPRSAGRTAAWAIGAVVVLVLSGVLVARAADQRTGSEGLSGEIRQTASGLLSEAQAQFAAGDLEGALATYDEVLEQSPTNVEALTYKAWVGKQSGVLSDEEALALLDEALAVSADVADAKVFRAIVLHDLGRSDEAAAQLVAIEPDDVPPFMGPLVARFGVEVADALASADPPDLVGANEVIDTVLVFAPEDLNALVFKGTLLATIALNPAVGPEDRVLLEGRAVEALDAAVTAAEADQPDQLPAALIARAAVLVELGRLDAARADVARLDGLDVPDELTSQRDALREALAAA